MEQYWKFIKKYSVGMEGSSSWIWYYSEGIWESKGYAASSIEQSLDLLEQFVYENLITINDEGIAIQKEVV